MSIASDLTDAIAVLTKSEADAEVRIKAHEDVRDAVDAQLNATIALLQANPTAADVATAVGQIQGVQKALDAMDQAPPVVDVPPVNP